MLKLIMSTKHWPVGEMVNTLPSQGNIHGFKSHTGHQLCNLPLSFKGFYFYKYKIYKKKKVSFKN